MPCTADEAIRVFSAAKGLEGRVPFGDLISQYQERIQAGEDPSVAPLVKTVYIESLDDSGLTVAAGNRQTTYWKFRLELTGGNPVQGRFSALEFNNDMWPRNIWDMNCALRDGINKVGGKKLRWPSEM